MKIIIEKKQYDIILENMVVSKSKYFELSPYIKILKNFYGDKFYNYVTNDGVEVTISDEDVPIGTIYGEQNVADIYISYIGTKNRGTGLASRELKKIISFADKYDKSLSIIIDPHGATTSPQGHITGVFGLNSSQIKTWLEKYGFIFGLNNASYGYRPKKSEEKDFFEKDKTISVPIDNIDVNKIEDTFDIDVLFELSKENELDEGIYYEVEDGYLFLYKDSDLYRISNVRAEWDYEKGIYILHER